MKLTSMALSDLAAAWSSLTRPETLWQGLKELGTTYGLAAGTLAADWYDEARTDAGIDVSIVIEPAGEPTDGLWRWIASEALAGDPNTALGRMQGEMQRAVADAHRRTITDLSGRDPEATGWRRVGQGENCRFCNMLIARGAIYKAGKASRFAAHPHCNCLAEPAFEQGPAAPALPYSRSPRAASDRWRAANARRVREYLAKH